MKTGQGPPLALVATAGWPVRTTHYSEESVLVVRPSVIELPKP
jgi:hypothetical protein